MIAWVGPTVREYFGRSLGVTGLLLAVLWLLTAAPYYAVSFAALAWARPHLPRALWLWLVPAAWVTACGCI